jgi:hypothetical protein
MQTDTKDGGLAQLCAQPATYTGPDGRTVLVAPIKIRQLGAFARAVEPLLADLAGLAGQDDAVRGSALMLLAARRADAVASLVVSATDCDASWLGEQDLVVLVELLAHVLEVNADFFVQRLLPQLERLLPRLSQRIEALTGSA